MVSVEQGSQSAAPESVAKVVSEFLRQYHHRSRPAENPILAVTSGGLVPRSLDTPTLRPIRKSSSAWRRGHQGRLDRVMTSSVFPAQTPGLTDTSMSVSSTYMAEDQALTTTPGLAELSFLGPWHPDQSDAASGLAGYSDISPPCLDATQNTLGALYQVSSIPVNCDGLLSGLFEVPWHVA